MESQYIIIHRQFLQCHLTRKMVQAGISYPRVIKNRLIGLVGRVFASVPGDLDSVPGRVISKILKWYLIPCITLSKIRYVSRVKWSNLGKGVKPSPTSRYSSYWKGSIPIAPDYGRQLYFTLYIYIYIYAWFDNKDTFCLYNLIKIISSFLISVLISGQNLWMNLPKVSRALSELS